MDDLDQLISEIEGEEPQRKETNPVKQLRDTLKARDKERKELLAELEELRSFKAEAAHRESVSNAAKVFTAVGLSDKQAELYVKLNPEADVTPEAVREFATAYGLPVSTEEGEQPSHEAPFRPAEGGVPADGKMNRDDLNRLYKENPAAAIKALEQGRVRWNNPDVN